MGLRPAPALRWYSRPGSRRRTGIKGSTLLHKRSETVQDLIWAILNPSSPPSSRCKREIQLPGSNSSLFTDKFLVLHSIYSSEEDDVKRHEYDYHHRSIKNGAAIPGEVGFLQCSCFVAGKDQSFEAVSGQWL